MQSKADVLLETEVFRNLLKDLDTKKHAEDGIVIRSQHYVAIGCDLRHLVTLERLLGESGSLEHCFILFLAEVSLTYMDFNASDEVIKWASSFAKCVSVNPRQP